MATFTTETRRVLGPSRWILGAWLLTAAFQPTLSATEQQPCPYKIDTRFEEPLRTSSKFVLTMVPDSTATLKELKIDFGVHNLYEIKDSGGNKIDQSTLMSKEPTRFAIDLGPDNPGLISLAVSSASSADCADSHLIDSGFRDIVVVKSSTPGIETNDAPASTTHSGDIPFSIGFVRASTDKSLYFSLPLTLLLEVSGEEGGTGRTISSGIDGGKGSSSARVTLPPGTSPSFVIKDDHWGKTGTVKISVFRDDQAKATALGTYMLHYRTSYPSWILFLMIVVGALLYVAIESIPALNKSSGDDTKGWWALVTKDHLSKIYLAIGVSAVIFLFKDASFLKAIKLDSSSLLAYLTYGFCAGALGLEALLKKVKELL